MPAMYQSLRTVLLAAVVAAVITVALGRVGSPSTGPASSGTTAFASDRAAQDRECPLEQDAVDVCIEPEQFHTTYELRTKTGDGRDLVVLSGYAEIDGSDLVGKPDGSWNRKGLVFRIGPRFRTVDRIAPVVSMTSIMNVNAANNAGWAVDFCEDYETFTPSRRSRTVFLQCRVGVRDSDGFMFRVNYYATMLGRLA